MKRFEYLVVIVISFACGTLLGHKINGPTASEVAKAEYHTYTDAYFAGYQDAIYAIKNNMATAGVIQTQYLYRVVQIVDDDLPEAESRELWNTYQTCNWAGE